MTYPPVQRGLGKNILMAALADPWIKYAVVVNKDVNIDDPNEVNWAIRPGRICPRIFS